MTRSLHIAGAALLALVAFVGCTTTPRAESVKIDLQRLANDARTKAQQVDPTMAKLFNEASGYAIFPGVGQGGMGPGGSVRGVYYEKGGIEAYSSVVQVSKNAQAEGQVYTEIVFFETARASFELKVGRFAVSAQTPAVPVKSGAAADAKYANGVVVFTMSDAAGTNLTSVGDQRFNYVGINDIP